MNISENFMVMVNLTAFLFFTAWVIKLVMEWKKFRRQTELHHKLIERFANVQELSAFLETESGGKFLSTLPTEKSSPTRDKLLSSIQKAIILAFLGGAFFAISRLYITAEENQAFGIFGIIAIALGLGFAVSTAISFILSKKWGIINGD
jgi:hypothetical protein